MAVRPHESVHTRLPVVDLFKAVAAQIVVLHHLAWYGPLSHVVAERWPDLLTWFVDNGPLAPPAFLAISGYLAARSLAPEGIFRKPNPWQVIGQRYQRLTLPFALALIIAILGAAIATWIYPHPATPDVSGLLDVTWRFVMHLLLLHSIFEIDALTTGVWYVAIDFQLFALMVSLLALARWLAIRMQHEGSHDWALLLIYIALALSLWSFNRNPEFDPWAIYFMGAYGIGAMAWWLIPHHHAWGWGALLMTTVITSLVFDFRERIAVAAGVGLLLWISGRYPQVFSKLSSKISGYFARISFSVFLVHFPICLVVNALFMRWLSPTPLLALFGILVAWAASNIAGAVFERYIERRA